MKKRLVISMVFSCLLFGGMIQMAQADQQNIDLTGTEWVLQGSGSLNAGKFGSERISGYVYVSFKDNGSVDITDEEDYTIHGQYGYDSDNKFFVTVDADELTEFISGEIGWLSNYADITVTSSKSQTTLKAGKLGLSLSLNLDLVVTVEVDGAYTNNGKPVEVAVRYNIALKGTHSLAAESQQEGAAWIIDAATTCKVRKLKSEEDNKLIIYFGPSSTQSLSSIEFLVYSLKENQWQEIVQGHFIRKGNNITFIPANESVENILNNQLSILIEDNEDIYGAYVVDSVSKWTAAVKDGVSIKLNGQTTFDSWMEMDNGDEWRGTFTVKGTGVPYIAEPQPE
jgi:hypothetical protein